MDAFREKYRSLSPYHYAANDPLRLKDPSGDVVNIYYMTSAPTNGIFEAFGHNAISVKVDENSKLKYFPAGGDFVKSNDGLVSEMHTIQQYVDNDRKVYKMSINLSAEAEEYLSTRIEEIVKLGALPPGGCCTQEVRNILVEAFEFGDGLTKDEAKQKVNSIISNTLLPTGTETDPEELAKRGYIRLQIFSADDGYYFIDSYTLNKEEEEKEEQTSENDEKDK